jgi:hypothetical protein
MLNQFLTNSRHVSRLLCEDVSIFLEEFDEREFLFGIQIVAYVSNLGRLLRGQQNRLAECVLWLDGRLGLGHDQVRGGTRPRRASAFGALRTPSVYQLSHNSLYRSQKST